ncbi:hypothetical protein BH23GEM9_BH23GEM9_23560 [soil metagenome]
MHQTPPAGGDGGGPGWVIALVAILLLAGVLWFAFLRGGGDTSPGVPDEIQLDVDVRDGGGSP